MMTEEQYKIKFGEEDAVGWDFIDQRLNNIYQGIEPRHYGPLCGIHYMAGGTDPIDGISVYDSKQQSEHLHLVSYGMSELYYAPEKAGGEFSKWGFEFTFRLKPFVGDNGDPGWTMHVFNNLARYVYSSGRWFEENQFIPANGPIRLETDTQIIGFVTTLDPELGKIETPHGELSFIQLVGITQKETDLIKENLSQDYIGKFIENMKLDNPLLITDLSRK
jgi:hypothetical protein